MKKTRFLFAAIIALGLGGCASRSSTSVHSYFRLEWNKAYFIIENVSDRELVVGALTGNVTYVTKPVKGTEDHLEANSQVIRTSVMRDQFPESRDTLIRIAPGKTGEFQMKWYRPPKENEALAIRVSLNTGGLKVENGLELDGSLLRAPKHLRPRVSYNRNSGIPTRELAEILGFVGRKSKYDVLGVTVKNSRRVSVWVGIFRGPLNANGSYLVFEKKGDRWILVDESDWAC